MNWLGIALRGMAMGIAEVIPGVSGGTIAFITGIYEKLIDSIKAIGPGLAAPYRHGGIRAVWRTINGNFLLALGGGMAAGLLTGVVGVTYLLKHYPPVVWAFFFGLIVGSAIFVFRQLRHIGAQELLALAAGFGIAFYVTVATPAHGSDALWMVFISGAIAISAMLLPGISGSFILLLMGMYMVVLPAVKDSISKGDPHALTVSIIFILGCLVGLATFSRVISWIFKHHRQAALALLTGFMAGSLNKLWPWHNVVQTRLNSKGEAVPFITRNVWPADYAGDPLLLPVLIAFPAGLAVVFLLDRLGTKIGD